METLTFFLFGVLGFFVILFGALMLFWRNWGKEKPGSTFSNTQRGHEILGRYNDLFLQFTTEGIILGKPVASWLTESGKRQFQLRELKALNPSARAFPLPSAIEPHLLQRWKLHPCCNPGNWGDVNVVVPADKETQMLFMRPLLIENADLRFQNKHLINIIEQYNNAINSYNNVAHIRGVRDEIEERYRKMKFVKPEQKGITIGVGKSQQQQTSSQEDEHSGGLTAV